MPISNDDKAMKNSFENITVAGNFQFFINPDFIIKILKLFLNAPKSENAHECKILYMFLLCPLMKQITSTHS